MTLNPQTGDQLIGLADWNEMVAEHNEVAGVAAAALPATTASATYQSMAGLAEAVQDIVGAQVVAGAGVTVTYNDTAGTITISAGAGTGLDAEGVRDTIGAALVAGSGVTITPNDAGDTITISATGGGGGGGAATTAAGLRYVTTDGNDANDGLSWATAKATIGAAEAALPPGGGIIQMGSGVFNGRFALVKDGTILQGIGRGEAGTVLRLPDGVNVSAEVLTITGDNVTVRDLRVDGNKANNTAIVDGHSDTIAIYADHVTIQNVWCKSARSHGIIAWGLATSTYSNATAPLAPRKFTKVLNCVIEDNGTSLDRRAAIDFAYDNVFGWVVDGCTVLGGADTLTCVTAHSGRGGVISNNTFVAQRAQMLELHSGADDIMVIGNLFIATAAITNAIRLRGITGTGLATNRITIIGNHFQGEPSIAGSRVRDAVSIDDTYTDFVKIANNTITAGTGTGACVLRLHGTGASPSCELLGNTITAPAASASALVIVESGSADPTKIYARHNRLVNAEIILGTGSVNEFDNFGAGVGSGSGGGTYTDEQVRDVIGTALVAGSGITITPDDAANTITLAATGGGGSYTDEQVRDVIGTALVAGTNVTITPNDVGDTITISASGAGGGGGATFGVKQPAGRYYLGIPRSSGAVESLGFVANTLIGYAIYVPDSQAFDRIAAAVTTAVAGTILRPGIYLPDGTNGLPGTLLTDGGSLDAGTTGHKENVVSGIMPAGMAWAVVQVGGTGASKTRTHNVEAYFTLGRASGDVSAAISIKATRTDAALPASLSGQAWSYSGDIPHGVLVRYA